MDEKESLVLKCKNCNYIWNYRGKQRPDINQFIGYIPYTSCPRCRANVKIIVEK